MFTPEGGVPERMEVFNFRDGGVGMAMYNTDEVIQLQLFHTHTQGYSTTIVPHTHISTY